LKISANTPAEAVAGLAAAMTQLDRDPDLLIAMSQSGRKRVEEIYSWKIKGRLLAQLYTELDLLAHPDLKYR
jgi:glycosyltransferase involved in cell wall biosynthesis